MANPEMAASFLFLSFFLRINLHFKKESLEELTHIHTYLQKKKQYITHITKGHIFSLTSSDDVQVFEISASN